MFAFQVIFFYALQITIRSDYTHPLFVKPKNSLKKTNYNCARSLVCIVYIIKLDSNSYTTDIIALEKSQIKTICLQSNKLKIELKKIKFRFLPKINIVGFNLQFLFIDKITHIRVQR